MTFNHPPPSSHVLVCEYVCIINYVPPSVLADEISPDTCRFWDARTGEKLDKDRFRRDLGSVEEAYEEMMRRVFGAR